MPTLFLRIPESGFQIIKWLKNLIFKNHMKKKKESDEDESQIISFQDKPQLSHLQKMVIISIIQDGHCKNCMIEHTCKHLASQSFTYTRRYTVNLVNYQFLFIPWNYAWKAFLSGTWYPSQRPHFSPRKLYCTLFTLVIEPSVLKPFSATPNPLSEFLKPPKKKRKASQLLPVLPFLKQFSLLVAP